MRTTALNAVGETRLQVIVVSGSHAHKYGSICRPNVLNAEPMQGRRLCDLMRDDQAGRQRCVVHHLTPLPLWEGTTEYLQAASRTHGAGASVRPQQLLQAISCTCFAVVTSCAGAGTVVPSEVLLIVGLLTFMVLSPSYVTSF